ncbi:MAG TPA: lactate racemase domain-containing protein, partial [Anaerolineales bacterium]
MRPLAFSLLHQVGDGLRAILDSLAHLPREQITLFNALGTHRANSEVELREMLGSELVDGYRIVQNDCFDLHTQVMVGRTSQGHEIWLNRALYECDLKILTGFIEPHFFAGFSGGGKAIMPGMAGQTTIFANHSAAMIAHPRATWGVTDGNPLWEEVRECALSAGRLFLVNVTLNRER